MNHPGHWVVFDIFDHSYRELPIRHTVFSPLHTKETSEVLSRLTRLRKFHPDNNGPVFCPKEQNRI